MNYGDLDLHALWGLVVREDDQALSELIRRLNTKIRRESMVRGQIDEDIEQDVRESLIRAIQSAIAKYKEEES